MRVSVDCIGHFLIKEAFRSIICFSDSKIICFSLLGLFARQLLDPHYSKTCYYTVTLLACFYSLPACRTGRLMHPPATSQTELVDYYESRVVRQLVRLMKLPADRACQAAWM